MRNEVLEKVLRCSRLPTLPAVALRVVELTSQKDVPLRSLSEAIQCDQGLAAKILRTVNSPFYGLPRPVTTIHQAQIFLGLGAVRTLALGFSLVSSIGREKERGFDYLAYWRRAVYTAVAARSAAVSVRCSAPEEAFLAGLLQDIGMVALAAALGDEYLEVVRSCAGRHHELSDRERKAIEITHADVGAALAERWRLPEALVLPIRFHERPADAPTAHLTVTRCVGLGNLAAEALSTDDPGPWIRRFRARAAEWLGNPPDRADELFASISAGASALADLLSVPVGPEPDIVEILSSANERLVDISLDQDRQTEAAVQRSAQLQLALLSDPLTGVASRVRIQEALAEAFDRAVPEAPVSFVLFDVDGLRELNASCGRDAGDGLLVRLARRLIDHFKPVRAVLGRWSGEEFAVLLPRMDRKASVALAEGLCAALREHPIDLIDLGVPPGVPWFAISAGVATHEGGPAAFFERPEHWMHAADQAMHAARRDAAATGAGGGAVRAFTPPRIAAA